MSDIIMGQRLAEVMNIWNEGSKYELFGFVLKGKAINLLKKGKLWVRDCAGIPSFKYYVTHELNISVSQAHRYDEIYREVGKILEDNGIKIGISAVTILLPFLRGKSDEQKLEILQNNKDLPLEAIKNNILEMQGKGDLATDVCMHDQGFKMYRKCRKCKKFFEED